MIYKTYRAPTYREAVLNAKMDLGNNVYIIGRKEVKEGGFIGLFRKYFTEITVAKSEERGNEQNVKATASSAVNNKEASPSSGRKTLLELMQEKSNEERTILNELKDIKNRLNELGDLKDPRGEKLFLEKLFKILNENDFSRDFIEQLRAKFEGELTVKEVDDPEILEEKLKGYLGGLIEVSGPIEVGKGRPTIVVLVGPTGVGKTTTIAKLAASYGVIEKRKVELITIDSYRIAAIEQLGKYAELMQLPLAVVNSREEFKTAVMNSKAELVFVDTAGRSQKNNMGLAEIRNILDGVSANLDVHLVMSATTKYRDAIDILTRFNQLMYNKLIITKLDETNTIGPLLSVLKPDKKISYITTGQSVPDDIELADKEKLLSMLTLEELHAG